MDERLIQFIHNLLNSIGTDSEQPYNDILKNAYDPETKMLSLYLDDAYFFVDRKHLSRVVARPEKYLAEIKNGTFYLDYGQYTIKK
jgi:hypothetical protein